MKKIIVTFILIITTATTFSQNQEATTEDGKKVLLKPDGTWSYIKINNESSADKTYPFVIVEQAPRFRTCNGSNAENKKCFSKIFREHFHQNFDKIKMQNLGIKRISISFIITKNGEIDNIKVRPNNEELKKETRRVLYSLDNIQAGKHHNNYVNVNYAFPYLIQY